MSNPHYVKVLILGAGPAGLALGRELSVRAIPYLILEKESMVGSTFVKMTASTTFGPWLNNTLPGAPVPWTQLLRRTTRADYAQYLLDYSIRNELRVLCGVEVASVQEDRSGFLVRTRQGDSYRADHLVNATGVFSKPNLPNYPGSSLCAIPTLHSSAYRDPETIVTISGRKRAKVLIVGSRLSAGEILEELHEAGHEVHLSHREPIDTWPSPLEETLLSPLTFLWEEASLRLGLSRPSNLRPRLRRGRQWTLLVSGQVRCHPDILRLETDRVVFTDRADDRYDVILYATGYRPAMDHLEPMLKGGDPWLSGLESAEIPNLYFLGVSGSRSFRSEFLRGIREDSVFLANLLARRLTLETEVGGRGNVVSLPATRNTGPARLKAPTP